MDSRHQQPNVMAVNKMVQTDTCSLCVLRTLLAAIDNIQVSVAFVIVQDSSAPDDSDGSTRSTSAAS